MENIRSEPQVLLGYLGHAHAIGTRLLFPLLHSLGTRLMIDMSLFLCTD